MQDLWKRIGAPRHLMVFEAAARLGSFTRAAREINVQQPAVSAAIRALEDRLGVALFHRAHRRVELTAAGARLYADVSRALGEIARSAEAIQRRAAAGHVTLNASSAFAYYWMIPRLGDLHARHPEIDLRLQSSDREPDIESEGIDLAIRRGTGVWPGCEAALIAREVIYPIAGSARGGLAGMAHPGALVAARLIHLEEPVRVRPRWVDWFAHHGVPGDIPSAGLRLNDYALVLQAALADEGVAFGWHHIVEGLVARGLLVARTDWGWATGMGFYLVWSKHRPLSAEAREVRAWMLAQAVAAPGNQDGGPGERFD